MGEDRSDCALVIWRRTLFVRRCDLNEHSSGFSTCLRVGGRMEAWYLGILVRPGLEGCQAGS